jgi:hypothetical protein
MRLVVVVVLLLQVWQLLMEMLWRRREAEGSKTDALLATVFQLSFCSLGAGYSMDLLSKSEQVLPASPQRVSAVHLSRRHLNICEDGERERRGCQGLSAWCVGHRS